MYQLYYYPGNASLAPHFLLHYMQLDYELLLVDRESNAQKSPEYLALNPTGRIPTLIDDGQAIFESAAICIHLCEQHPEYNLIPKIGTNARPQFFQWLTYLSNTLQAELMVHYYPHRHTKDKNSIEGIVAAQDELITEALMVIDKQLSGKQYLLGEQLTACDFYLFMLAKWSLPIEKSPSSFPSLINYLKRMSLHPTIEAVSTLETLKKASLTRTHA